MSCGGRWTPMRSWGFLGAGLVVWRCLGCGRWVRRSHCVLTTSCALWCRCVASVDGVHIPWERAPDSARSWYVGKSGFPTLMFNVSVTHDGKILNVSGPNPGARNDKMAVRWDNFVQSIKDKLLYADVRQVPRVVARFASVV
jgi:hypothetical protein